jgi:transglutaminase-like putative cysteine protease/ubiquinone/menaquinone biosynthesis C-methylase UbiE
MRNLALAAVWLLIAPFVLRAEPIYGTCPASADGIGKTYMGREIAQVMGHQAADWLDRPEREIEEQPRVLIDSMELKGTDVAADIGAGTGYLSVRMARRLPKGKVLAVDIQPEMLELLSAKAKKLGVKNVEPLLGTTSDPKLPAAGVDVVLMVDAYHEFDQPREMMEGIVRGLRDGGRVVLVEYRGEDPKVPIKPHHKMTEAQAKKEMAAVGLTHVVTKEVLPWQHIMIFRKGDMASEENTGASAAFTSSDPVVKQALSLLGDGKFKEAQSLLASDDGHADPAVQKAREEMKEIIRRVRRDYSLDPDAMVAKLKNDIPDVTPADLDRWRKAGEIQAREIDGQVKYFRREPANLFRFSEEAKKRRKETPSGRQPNWTLVQHLANVVAEAEKTDKTEVLPIRHRMTYVVTIDPNRPGAKAGSVVRAWLPFCQEYRQQKDVKLVSSSPADAKIAPGDAPQRTVYFEQKIEDPSKPLTFKEVFEFTSYAYYPLLKDELAKRQASGGSSGVSDEFLAERAPHIVFSPELKKKVAEVVGDEINPLVKVRKIFHWIDANIRYHAEQEYSTIPSFSLACLSRQKGDCGVQSTLFITMCRAAGVPARWQSGWETKRIGNSMHDWTEVYIEPWGWLPCDPSYGVQKSDDPKIADFYIGHQDSYRMIINLDYGRQLVPPKQSLRSEPADFQVGEIEIDGRNLFYDEWDYDMNIEWLDPEPASVK